MEEVAVEERCRHFLNRPRQVSFFLFGAVTGKSNSVPWLSGWGASGSSSMRLFDELFYFLFEKLKTFRSDWDYAESNSLNLLLQAIRRGFRLHVGFSSAVFLRQAIIAKKRFMRVACVRGRLCFPPEHWRRSLLHHSPRALC